MKAVTAAQMRELDARTIRERVPGSVLMERAGAGVARCVEEFARSPCRGSRDVLVVAGKGNNGGDGFVAARLLAAAGIETHVVMTAPPDTYTGDAAAQLERMRGGGRVPCQHLDASGWAACLDEWRRRHAVIVDGVLGTGVTGPIRGSAAAAVGAINALGRHAPVVAIDIPSGLDADTGRPLGDAVHADATVTMGCPKLGLLQPCAVEFTGSVTRIDIGIPPEFTDELASDLALVSPTLFPAVTERRLRNAHKGTFGHVLLVGGAPGLAGAIALAARGALRSGVGLVSALVPESIASDVATLVPEAMVHRGAVAADGGLAKDCIERWKRDVQTFSAILVGPGLTVTRDTQTLTERLLAGVRSPVVVDADAINVCAHRMFLFKRSAGPVVLTPHPGEMGRLLGCDAREVQDDRFGAARNAADAARATVVLKGAGTVIARHGEPLWVNLTGNPGMATGGMGDVLAGLLAGLAAQGIAPESAAAAAVYLHGRAADLAARRGAEPCLTAGDVIAALPEAWRELR